MHEARSDFVTTITKPIPCIRGGLVPLSPAASKSIILIMTAIGQQHFVVGINMINKNVLKDPPVV